MPQARFLAVACFERKITRTQAWQIDEESHRYISLSIDAPRVGEIAVELGILTPDVVEWLLERLNQYRLENKALDDPLAHRPPIKAFSNFTIRFGVIAGFVILLILAGTWFFTDHNWGFVALVASIIGTLWIALSSILPDLFSGNIAAHRAIPWLSVILGPLSWGYCVYVVYRELHFGPNANNANKAWHRFFISMMLLLVTFIVFYSMSKWRHYEIWYLEARVDLMRGLVSKTYMAISRLQENVTPSEHEDALSYARQVMHEAARIVMLNPWERLLRRLLFNFGPIGAVSLWYLEPETNGNETFERFNIKLVVAPGAPQEVLSAFDLIRQNHHPVSLKQDRFQQAINNSMVDGDLDHQTFMDIPDRSEFVSAVGFVFERKQGIHSGNARKHLFFDHSYITAINKGQLSYTVKRWLDFNSFAAYPVITLDPKDCPIGVLIAFKNLRNGITPEDKNSLVIASRLLGLLLSDRTRHQRKVDPS